jgi:imidazolonepropionase-like amidohydrolase
VTSDHDPIDTVQYTLKEIRAIVQSATDWRTDARAHAIRPRAYFRSSMVMRSTIGRRR